MGRYYKSYKIHEKEAYIESFNKDGFVVIDDVLNQEECKQSCEEIWDYLEHSGKISRNNPLTWGNECWPKEICRNGGFMGKFPYWKRMKKLDESFVNKQPCAWKNRENTTVYEVFRNLLGTERLWVSIDRYGVMRPVKVKIDDELDGIRDLQLSHMSNDTSTESIEMPKNLSADYEDKQDKFLNKDEWKTKADWLHWDLSPFHYGTSAAGFAPSSDSARQDLSKDYGSLRLQGLISITDCPEENGGFHCIPGFHGERFYKWADQHRSTYGAVDYVSNRNFIEVPENDEMRKEVVRVPIRAGSLLVWNSQLPHGNFPNDSKDFRMVQYIKMIPVDDPREFKPAMAIGKFTANDWFPEDYTPSELGKMLFGIKDWPKVGEYNS